MIIQVLSKLKVTTHDLTKVKAELDSVKLENVLMKAELANITNELLETNSKLSLVGDRSESCAANLTLVTKQQDVLRHDQEATKQEVMSCQMNVTSVQLSVDSVASLESNVSKILVWQSHVDASLVDLRAHVLTNTGNLSSLNDFKLTVKDIGTQLKNVKIDVKIVTAEVENVKAQVIPFQPKMNNVQVLVHQIQTSQIISDRRVGKIRRDVGLLQGDLAKVEKDVNATVGTLARVTANSSARIGFQATVVHSHVANTLLFTHVTYNSGTGYKHNGRFVAPVAGPYIMWATVSYQAHGVSENIKLRIQTEYGPMAMGYRSPSYRPISGTVFDSPVYDMLSATAVIDLKVGDHVWVTSNVRTPLLAKACSFGGALLN